MRVAEWLEKTGITYEVSSQLELRHTSKQWLEAFCTNIYRRKGKWVIGQFRFNAFISPSDLPALEGTEATELYISQELEPYYIFDEEVDVLYSCHSESWPDLMNAPCNDLYVFPKTMAWTYIMTHERPDLGPFFAFKPEIEHKELFEY